MTELESIKSNIQTQDHENGSSENVTVNDIPTIQDTTTGGAPTDIQEGGAGSDPVEGQEGHTESPPTKVSQRWWPFSIPSKTPQTSGTMCEVPEGVPNPVNKAVITQEELLNLTSKISAMETSQQAFQQRLFEANRDWGREFNKDLDKKLDEELDTIEDNTTKEMSALEKRLGHTITSLEQRVKTMEAGLQNMKP